MSNPEFSQLSPASVWILSKYIELEKELQDNLETYELSHSVQALYRFLWNDFADWYVEYLKTDTTQIPFAKELFKKYTEVLSPYAPFETEALWKEFFNEESILALEVHDHNWGKNAWENLENKDSGKEFEIVIDFITNLRSLRGLFAIDPVTPIVVGTDDQILLSFANFVKLVAKTEITDPQKEQNYLVKALQYNYQLNIFDYIKDPEAEKARTKKIIIDLEKQITALQSQLSNPKFLEKAETEVVSQKQADLKERTIELQQQQDKLAIL